MEEPAAVIVTGRGLRETPGLGVLLGCPVVGESAISRGKKGSVVAAWGHRPSAKKAEEFAAKHHLPLWRLEDGWLRSLGLRQTDPPLSIVVDNLGIHYDATAPSRVEALILQELSPEKVTRARALLKAWVEGRVSKYNYARDVTGGLPSRYVLVADQTHGDLSISRGLGHGASFERMLHAALDDHPDCEIVLKVHPQVWAGRRKGNFDLEAIAKWKRVRILSEDVHPASLMEKAVAVYCVTSQLGFEALLWRKPVHTFGMPFYAGWGLTRDALAAPGRRHPVSLEQLVHAAFIDYPRYLDPETQTRCEVERVLEWMSLQRRMRERFPATVYATGFSPWKKPLVQTYFSGSRVRFVEWGGEMPADSTLTVWGRKPVPGTLPRGVDIVRLEDGFLRSVGLGADLIRPLSWVMDRRGIYYDASAPSDLEHLLQTYSFDDALRARASRLRERIVQDGLTKYNVGRRNWQRPDESKKVILVPGQVESDASIQLGAPGLRTNLALLRAVREAHPDAHLIYKPHPDVVAKLRKKGKSEQEARHWCDEVVIDVAMNKLLDQVDEVHVLTSLTGFEALLRGRKVVCYGHPFYAGWGLTEDKVLLERRTRRLSLDELVAGTLILYPTYICPTTGFFTTPERTLVNLLQWRKSESPFRPLWRRMLRRILQLRAR